MPENHLSRYLLKVIDQLDLSKLTKRYGHRGIEAYHPGLLLASGAGMMADTNRKTNKVVLLGA